MTVLCGNNLRDIRIRPRPWEAYLDDGFGAVEKSDHLIADDGGHGDPIPFLCFGGPVRRERRSTVIVPIAATLIMCDPMLLTIAAIAERYKARRFAPGITRAGRDVRGVVDVHVAGRFAVHGRVCK